MLHPAEQEALCCLLPLARPLVQLPLPLALALVPPAAP
jgi:hypothetical protein